MDRRVRERRETVQIGSDNGENGALGQYGCKEKDSGCKSGSGNDMMSMIVRLGLGGIGCT